MVRTLIISLLTLLCTQMYAQDGIVERIVRVRHLISDSSDFNPSEAFTQLQLIEKDCAASDNDTLRAVFWGLKGQALFFMERYKDSIAPCKEAIQLFERCNLRQYEYLDAFRIIAMSYHRINDLENAENYYRKGLTRSVAANVATTDQYRADLYLNLGNLYKAKGDSALAEDCYNRSKQLHNVTNDIEKWNYIDWENSYWDKINAFTQAEKYQEAVDAYSEMIPGIRENRGKDKTYILAIYSKAILLSRYLNKYDEAIPLYNEVVEIGKKISTTDESVCGAYCNLALSYAYKGDFSKAEAFIQESQSSLIKANSDYYPPHSIYRFAGNGAYWTQNYEMAIKYYESYLSPQNKREIGNSYDEITNQLSVSYILASKPQKAEQLLKGFLKTEERRLKTDNPPTLANIFHNLGRSVMLGGDKSEALKYLNKSKDLQINVYGEGSERTLQYINECNAK